MKSSKDLQEEYYEKAAFEQTNGQIGPCRRTDPRPVKCLECGWDGRQMDCVHTYHGYGYGDEADVEPIDKCPHCGAVEPEPILALVEI